MIEEKFLESAVRIRKNYLKISSNLEFYHRKAKEIIASLEDIVKKVEELSAQITNDHKLGRPSLTKDKAMEELMKILRDLEDQSKIIENLTEPMNKNIEKLAIEEQELYRQIKEKNSHLTDEQIIDSVRKRLEDENLA